MFIKDYIKKSIATKETMLASSDFLANIEAVSLAITEAYRQGAKLLAAGNGGSAADAQHMACELVSKFCFDRKALPAIALSTNTSIITSVGNDFDFDYIFSRQIEALGNKNDVFVAISTSGNSKNIVLALKKAKEKGLLTVGLTGNNISLMDEFCDYLIKVPSATTPVIQESHIMIIHIICAMVEKAFV